MNEKTRNLIIALATLVLLCYLAIFQDGGRIPGTSEGVENQNVQVGVSP